MAAHGVEHAGPGVAVAEDRPLTARVLVVDDSFTNLELVEQQLRSIGHEPVLASDARAALAQLDDSIDIVLMDVNMPDVDGLEATRWIRAAGWRTPVVALTAAAMAADRSACTLAGMDGFLTKPIGLSGLADAVREWVAPGRVAPAAPARTRPPVGDGPLDELVREAGELAAIGVTRSYLRESERRVAELYEAAALGDNAAFVRQAHTLSSTSLLVGGEAVAERCAEAERAGLAGTDTVALCEQLEVDYGRLRTRLLAALADLEASAR
jgi:CheY-like chemotaxis protein